MTDQAQLVDIKGLGMRRAGKQVLHKVDFSVSKGEIVTIVGPNGSGKSTLLQVIIGSLSPTDGTVERASGLRIGYVPQKLSIDPSLPLTTWRFLDLPKRSSAEAKRTALETVQGQGLEKMQLSELSGGQFQRVLLARALLTRPNLLLLDEPTQGLDQPGSAAFYKLIADIRRETGVAIVMVSHELHVVMSASDRVVCMNGHICCQGTPEVVSNAPEYRALFGTGTQGALALFRHEHNHDHDHDHDHAH